MESQIKIGLGSVIECLNSLRELNERVYETKDGKVLFPEVKTKKRVGYWLGRLEDKLSSLNKTIEKRKHSIFKEFSEDNIVDGNNKGKHVPGTKINDYAEKVNDLLSIEEVIDFKKFEYSDFESDKEETVDQMPKHFWATVGVYFVNEPK